MFKYTETFENMIAQANQYLISDDDPLAFHINGKIKEALWEAFNEQIQTFERQHGGPLMNFPGGLKMKKDINDNKNQSTSEGNFPGISDGIPLRSFAHPGINPDSIEDAEIELPNTPHNINCKKLEILGKLANSLNNIAIQISKLEFLV